MHGDLMFEDYDEAGIFEHDKFEHVSFYIHGSKLIPIIIVVENFESTNGIVC